MRLRIRLWFHSQLVRFLGQFAEVRELRKLRTEYEARVREAYSKQHAAEIKAAVAERDLGDANRALEVMTEARLNADRAVEVIRGQMETLRETADREIASMKQMVDWFGLEGRGRQVFGTAPLAVRPKEEGEPNQTSGSLRARQFVQRASAENLQSARADADRFMQEAEELFKRNGSVPTAGPEYSSTSRAVEEQVA